MMHISIYQKSFDPLLHPQESLVHKRSSQTLKHLVNEPL